MLTGGTDAAFFRERGAVAYGAGMFSARASLAEFQSRFHGHDERIDTESLGLSARALDRRRRGAAHLTGGPAPVAATGTDPARAGHRRSPAARPGRRRPRAGGRRGADGPAPTRDRSPTAEAPTDPAASPTATRTDPIDRRAGRAADEGADDRSRRRRGGADRRRDRPRGAVGRGLARGPRCS